jgi:hypothetical protein
MELEEILQKDLSQGFHTFPLSRNLKSGSYFVGVETGTEKYSSVFVVR